MFITKKIIDKLEDKLENIDLDDKFGCVKAFLIGGAEGAIDACVITSIAILAADVIKVIIDKKEEP